jgi:hypothetical protein
VFVAAIQLEGMFEVQVPSAKRSMTLFVSTSFWS